MTDAREVWGVIGTGTITSAVVTGTLTCASFKDRVRFVVSPRSAAKAEALAAQFPDSITIAESNQAVVDAAKTCLVGVLPKQAEDVLSALTFDAGSHVLLSLMAIVPSTSLSQYTGLPATSVFRCIPLPSVANQSGVTILSPESPTFHELFDALGGCVVARDDHELSVLMTVSCSTSLL
jgi:pyrroline-5-carboxylate reductase